MNEQLNTAITSFGQYGSSQENTRLMVGSDQGYSGTVGSGIAAELTGSATYTPDFQVRQVYVETAGNLSFQTLDGNIHVLPVANKSWTRPIMFKLFYQASHASYATTAAGVHLF